MVTMLKESWTNDLQELQKDAIAIIADHRNTETYFQMRDCTYPVAGQLRTACPCCIAVELGLAGTCFGSCQRKRPSGTSVDIPYSAGQASVAGASESAVAGHTHVPGKEEMAGVVEVATSGSEDSRYTTESVDAQTLHSCSSKASLDAIDWAASWTLLVQARSSGFDFRNILRMWAGSSATQHATSSQTHGADHPILQQLAEPAV